MKRIFSILLCLIIMISICFQCAMPSSAFTGVEEAILIGTLCFDLLSFGITIHNVSSFIASPTFQDFSNSIANRLDQGFEIVKRNGELFFATSSIAWKSITDWIKSHFSGRNETKAVEYSVTETVSPTTITLSDGAILPYAEFMAHPFFIYNVASMYEAFESDAENVGFAWGSSLIQIYCTGHGNIRKWQYKNGSWNLAYQKVMTYGIQYKGVTGSYYNADFGRNVNADKNAFYLYRTMPRTNSAGTAQETTTPDETPKDETEETTASVTMSSKSDLYPKSVDAPADEVKEGEKVLIKVKSELIENAGTNNETITTDKQTLGRVIEETDPVDVNPKVLTKETTATQTVEQIVSDTPVAEMDSVNAGSASSDIETANKFRLPQSFLEGFPFSIPYSVYCGIQSFVSDPVAPTFDLPFSIERLHISENVEIDLSQWNPVAKLCRALLSLVWVAGLAMACSKFIKR